MRRPVSRGRPLRNRAPLAVRLLLNPSPEDRAALAAWPERPLPVDFTVAAAGEVLLTVGNQRVAYEGDRLVLLKPGEPLPPRARATLPEYLPAFAANLAAALAWLEGRGNAGRSCWAGMVESPVGLRFHRVGGSEADPKAAPAEVEVTYHETEAGPAIYRARLPSDAAARTLRQALLDYRDQLLALNPRLAEHPAVRRLTEALRER